MRNIVFFVLLLLVFLVPWEGLVVVSESVTLARWIGYFAAFLAALYVVSDMSLRHVSWTFVLLVLFWLYTTLSIVWSTFPEATMMVLLTNFSLMVFAWLIVEFAQPIKQQLWVLRVYLLGCLVPLSMLFYIFATVGAGTKTRFTAAGNNANYLADVLLYSIPMAVYLASMSKDKIRLLYWCYIPAAGIGVLLSGSRAAGLALALYAALTVLKFVRASWVTKIMLIATAACLIVLIPRVVPTFLLERITSVSDISEKREARFKLWEAGWETFQKYPFLGAGLGAYGMETSGEFGAVAHNVFISVLSETGIIGFTIYMLFLMMLFLNVRQLPRGERSLWTEILAIWVLIAMTAPLEYGKSTWMIYGVILAQSSYFQSLRTQMKRASLRISPRSKFITGTDRPSPA